MKHAFRFLVLFGAALVPPAAAADPFDRLVDRWSKVHDYVVEFKTFETYGGKTSRSRVAYSYRKPDRARLEVLEGYNRGAVVLWDGGTQAVAYKRGPFSLFKLRADVDDKRLSSLRGNDVLTPNLDYVLACFRSHRSDVTVLPGPSRSGEATEEIELRYAGYTCPYDSKLDADVTRDVLVVGERDEDVVRRERYAGSTLVESYDVRNLSINVGLDDSTFK